MSVLRAHGAEMSGMRGTTGHPLPDPPRHLERVEVQRLVGGHDSSRSGVVPRTGGAEPIPAFLSRPVRSPFHDRRFGRRDPVVDRPADLRHLTTGYETNASGLQRVCCNPLSFSSMRRRDRSRAIRTAIGRFQPPIAAHKKADSSSVLIERVCFLFLHRFDRISGRAWGIRPPTQIRAGPHYRYLPAGRSGFRAVSGPTPPLFRSTERSVPFRRNRTPRNRSTHGHTYIP